MNGMSKPELERTFRGHRNAVTAASFHPQLQQLASSSNDGNIMVWNFKPTMRALRFVGHRGLVNDVTFNSQGNLIASCSTDASIRLWIPNVKGESSAMKAHAGSVRSVRFSRDGLVLISGGDDKAVKLWSTTTQRFTLSFTGHQNWVRGVAITPDARLCASCGDDKLVQVWDPNTKKATHTFYDHVDAVTCVVFHPEGTCVAAGSADRTINIWDLRMNQLLQHYDAHQDTVSSIDFHPSGGGWLLSSSLDGSVKLWDLPQGYLYCTVNAHDGPVHGARFSPCGSQFATTGHDALVMVWNSNIKTSSSPSGGRPTTANTSTQRTADPVNTILSPLAPSHHHLNRPRTATHQSANNSKSANVSQQQLRVMDSAAIRNDAQHEGGKQQLHNNPPQVQPTTTTSNPSNNIQDAPIERVLREVDIAAQTQKIMEHRITQSELRSNQISAAVRQRDVISNEQFEILKREVVAMQQARVEDGKEMNELKVMMAVQGEIMKQLVQDQKRILARFEGCGVDEKQQE